MVSIAEVASAFVSLAPTTVGWGRKIESQVGPEVNKAGKRVGKTFGGALGSAMKLGGLTAGVPSAPLFRVGPEELG